jgi:hypothetical protein
MKLIAQMRKLFGKKKEPALPEGPSLEEHCANLEKRIGVLRGKIEGCDSELRNLRELVGTSRGTTQNMHKQKMLQIMKRRKMYAIQLEQISSTQFNLDQIAFHGENIQSTVDSFNALKRAIEIQKQHMKKVDIDDLEDTVDSMQDMQYDVQAMNEIMSRSYAIDDINEEDLEAELAELDEELLEKNFRGSSVKTPVYLVGTGASDRALVVQPILI